MNEPTINVGVLTRERIDFDLYGDFMLEGSEKIYSGKFSAYVEGNFIRVEGEDVKLSFKKELTFQPTIFKSESFLLRDVIIGVKFHWEQKENQRFLGNLKLLRVGNKITVINIIPIEAYLTSVVSSEMSARSSINLLKAHSIISRSWLLAQLERSKAKEKYKTVFMDENELVKWYDREDHIHFDVCADDHCQRYQGITKIYTDVVKQAIEETRGIVLFSNDKVCDSRYYKSCGGITEAFENVWEPVKYSYLASIVDYKFEVENYNIDFSDETNARKWIISNPSAFCNTKDEKILAQVLPNFDQKTTDFYRWKVEYTQQELSDLIKEKSGIDFGFIVDLIPVERGYSARLIKLKIVGTKKTLTIGKELEIRRTLSKSHLYSAAFVVDKENLVEDIPQKFILNGAGWGHGVGLCQIGAAVMGQMGYKFDEILLHYFPGAHIKKLYN
ncbi:MAG: SpoIID/LytB domain-containing protein [Ignavibacteriales bacterium]|nr:SpoIID/LytB domain-containing protein [Ignavibacteriales bacterium]